MILPSEVKPVLRDAETRLPAINYPACEFWRLSLLGFALASIGEPVTEVNGPALLDYAFRRKKEANTL